MHVILCLDDRNGMLFNNRRQSADGVLRERLMERVGSGRLWMNSYSAGQFRPLPANVCVDETFLDNAQKGDYCFVENCDVTAYLHKAESLILYKWNRVYPAQMYFRADLVDNNWKLMSITDFKGNSHEKITEEIYEIQR